MPRAPVLSFDRAPPVINVFDATSGGAGWNAGAGWGFTNIAWPAANRALLWQFLLNDWFTFSQMGWQNGTTVSGTGHFDAGVYDSAGDRLVSNGGVVQGSASTFQAVSVTSTTLAPGYYWMALACDNTTSTVFCSNSGTTAMDRTQLYQQAATAYPLPSTVTLANSASSITPMIVIGGTTVL